MKISGGLGQYYIEAKGNKWFFYFAILCRIVLALGFIPSGIVKIMGERFTDLPVNHPLGHYLEALHLTGYYYPFIGVLQLIAAVFLLIPRTALLGAIIYFPIILNICVLAYAVRFEGTRITTLMLLANLYLLCWHYDRLKHLLLFNQTEEERYRKERKLKSKFPFPFFAFVFATAVLVVVINHFLYDIRPGNSMLECTNSCANSPNPGACNAFCECVYNQGKTLDKCLAEYEKSNAGQTNR
ncbi:MAG TPA: DoxX family protein [Chryseolinea sp.]